MSPVQVKIFLLKNGLTVGGMAKDLCRKGHSETALRVCLSQMFNGHRFYPSLAKRVNRRYGLALARIHNGVAARKATGRKAA